MIIDNKGKLFGKVSLIDIIIILVVIGAIAGITYKFTSSKSVGILQPKDKLEIMFYAEESPAYAVALVKVEDICRETVQNATFGKVSAVKSDKANSYAPDNNGKWVMSPKEGYSSMIVTIQGEGKYSLDGVTIDNAVYFIGKAVELKVGNSIFYGRIYNITRKD